MISGNGVHSFAYNRNQRTDKRPDPSETLPCRSLTPSCQMCVGKVGFPKANSPFSRGVLFSLGQQIQDASYDKQEGRDCNAQAYHPYEERPYYE